MYVFQNVSCHSDVKIIVAVSLEEAREKLVRWINNEHQDSEMVEFIAGQFRHLEDAEFIH